MDRLGRHTGECNPLDLLVIKHCRTFDEQGFTKHAISVITRKERYLCTLFSHDLNGCVRDHMEILATLDPASTCSWPASRAALSVASRSHTRRPGWRSKPPWAREGDLFSTAVLIKPHSLSPLLQLSLPLLPTASMSRALSFFTTHTPHRQELTPYASPHTTDQAALELLGQEHPSHLAAHRLDTHSASLTPSPVFTYCRSLDPGVPPPWLPLARLPPSYLDTASKERLTGETKAASTYHICHLSIVLTPMI